MVLTTPKNGRVTEAHKYVNPTDAENVSLMVASFVSTYGLNELNYRVNAVKRHYKKLQKAQRKMYAARVALDNAERTFNKITNPRDVWDED